ncbi:hypothetical protein L2E82_39110 [Cichorium intybus]|uniref:Uncharacterized protein n=1 Tax=Cichorium intybus TaxID=13427 RepID=A0ACB9AI78_CICIN|nr:hypothetical protein L2E82_39110 [Cichorium intybus]
MNERAVKTTLSHFALRQPTGDSQQLFGFSDFHHSIVASTSYVLRSPSDKSTSRQQVNSPSSSTYIV